MNHYELHITVQHDDVLRFANYCKDIKAKPLYIQLSNGEHPDQLMLAATHHELHTDAEALAWAEDRGHWVETQFQVTRIKLESQLTEGPTVYFEAHWKLDINYAERSYWLGKVSPLCHELDLLYSRNLFAAPIHYLSQRIYNCTDPLTAEIIFDDTSKAIQRAGLPLIKTHYERVIWDSNPTLDAGWSSICI